MLHYNLNNLFKARNIKEPNRFLVKHGISSNIAHRLVAGQTDKISLKILEKLCRALNCTPNDIYRFVPNNDTDKSERLALNKIAHTDSDYPDTTGIANIPLEKLSEIANIINNKTK
jgi:DNA-binding Xre family transcriptional regulator